MITINNLNKKFKDKIIFENFSISFVENKNTVILGPSGVGKTTLLNCISGLEQSNISLQKMKFSYVFQTPSLLPNLTIIDNLLLVNNNLKKCGEILYKFGLEDKQNEYPKSLSYGQQFRVSLARALLYESDVILVDECLANLDLKLKLEIIKIINSQFKNRTLIYVTHDIDEALMLGDEIIILEHNNIALKIENKKTNYGEENNNKKILIDTLLK